MMALDQAAVSNGVAVLALVISGLSLKRSAKKEDAADIEKAIDDRIQIKLGADIAVIKKEVEHISKSITTNSNIVYTAIDATANAITAAAREMLEIAKK